MASGQHSSTVILDGKADGLAKAANTGAKGIQTLEDKLAHFDKALKAASSSVVDFGKAVDTGTIATLQRAGKSFEGFLGKMRDVTVIGRGAIDAFSAVGSAVSGLAEEGLSATAIMGNLPFSIDKAASATHGLVSDLQLAKTATTLVSTGVLDNAEDFAKLAGAAQALGSRIGVDTPRTFESLTAALARGSTEMLDNLGVVLKQEQAYDMWAKTLGKTREQLTDAEKAEAFQKVALQKIFEAADGVSVKTDGAAAAVQRFNVELDNLKTGALAGDAATRTLEEGLFKIALQTRIQGKGVRQSGDDWFRLKDALRDVGVSSEELRVSQSDLGDALDRARRQRTLKIKDMLLEGEITDDLVEEMKQLLDVDFQLNDIDRNLFRNRIETHEQEKNAASEIRTGLEEELSLLEDKIAYTEGAGDPQRELVELKAQEAELQAQILEAEGKTTEATKVRRDAQLALLRASGEVERKGRGGRRRDIKLDLDVMFGQTEKALRRLEAQEERALRVLERTGAGAQKRFDDLLDRVDKSREAMAELQGLLDEIGTTTGPDPFSLESFGAVTQRTQELESAKAEIVLEQRLRAIEEQRALGVDPQTLADQEIQARFELLDMQEQAANDSIALMQITDQREQLLHEQRLARIEEERLAEEQALARRAELLTMGANVLEGYSNAVITAAFAGGKGLKEALRGETKVMAQRHAMIAVSETLKGAVAAASFNPIGAVAHFKNAAANAAFAGVLGIASGAMGGFGGKKTVAGGFDSNAFGAGGAGGGSRGGQSSPASSSSDPNPLPNSPAPTTAGSTSNPGQVIPMILNFNAPFAGSGKEFAMQVDKELRGLGYANGRARS